MGSVEARGVDEKVFLLAHRAALPHRPGPMAFSVAWRRRPIQDPMLRPGWLSDSVSKPSADSTQQRGSLGSLTRLGAKEREKQLPQDPSPGKAAVLPGPASALELCDSDLLHSDTAPVALAAAAAAATA